MPPKRTRATTAKPAQTEPEPDSGNGEVDYQKYVGKKFTATMEDYITWFEENVASLDDLEVDKILVLGVQMYSHFQKSDFNISRREERAAERAQTRAPADGPENEDEPPARTRTRKAPAAPAKGSTARTARSGASSSRSGDGRAKPARASGGRSRARAGAGAAAGGDAPF